MGNRKLKWTAEEEEALKAGVAKYGAGKWKSILTDSDIKLKLAHRSNVDLKDKWRNLGVSIRQGSGANTMTPNIETTATTVLPPKTENSSSVVTKNNIIEMTPNGQATAMSSPPPKTQKSSSVATKDNINEMTPKGQATAMSSPPPKTQNSSSVVTKDNINEKPSQSSRHAKNGPTYGEMIFEALSSIKDRNGSDFSSILEFIQKKHEVPQNFKKSLSSRLRKLVMQGKVKRVDKRYKIKQTSFAIEKASPKRKVVESKPRQKPRLCFSAKAEEDAAKTIAKHIAEAEHKLFIAAEAIHESERVSRMAEDSDAVVMHLKEIFELSVKTNQTSSMAAEAMNESALMSEDSNAAIMHLKEIFEQWEKTKQTTVAPNIELSTLSFT